MKTTLLCRLPLFGAFCLAAAMPAVAADNMTGSSPAAAVPIQTISPMEAPAATCTADAPADVPSLRHEDAITACSPPPQCWTDRDCDRICGRGNGQCVRVNSCYRQCACFSVAESPVLTIDP